MGYGRDGPARRDARFTGGRPLRRRVQLPGMLHGAYWLSPFATPGIVSIDTKAAEAHPKVKAVITGAVLETPAGPGLDAGKTRCRMTTKRPAAPKGPLQGQEVAFVVAEDRYSDRDAIEIIRPSK